MFDASDLPLNVPGLPAAVPAAGYKRCKCKRAKCLKL